MSWAGSAEGRKENEEKGEEKRRKRGRKREGNEAQTLGKIRKVTESSRVVVNILQLKLVGNIRVPFFSKALPVENINRARAKKRPHGHFESSSVRGGDNSHLVSLRDPQHLLGLFDGLKGKKCKESEEGRDTGKRQR